MRQWLVRHAQPLIAPGVCYGATDVAADEHATLLTARTLAQVLPPGLSGVISVFWEKATKFAHQIHCGSNTAVPRVLEVFERRSRFNRFNQPSRSPTLAAPSIARAVAVGYRFVDQYWR